MSYLYGAAIQGIQSFIFQTNELKDIVGASELINDACTSIFRDFLNKKIGPDFEQHCDTIISAAGNIKCKFKRKKDCELVVNEFSKIIMENVPGITISQAVAEYDDNPTHFSDCINSLEIKLHVQRNKPVRATELGLIGIQRSRQSGLPVVIENGAPEILDTASRAKKKRVKEGSLLNLCNIAFGQDYNPNNFTARIDQLTVQNSWVAIIHADGNGLGKVVQKIGGDEEVFKKFSQGLDKATKEAARKAFDDIKHLFDTNDKKPIPIRPIIIGGDDFTVVCRGDLAIPYTQAYLKHFESETERYLGKIIETYNASHPQNPIFSEKENFLTACAGIAFVKESYPFFHGYSLAEALCNEAKKASKSMQYDEDDENFIPPSSVMFHKIQDSFVNNYSDIENRELWPQDIFTFKFGPYFKDEFDSYWSIDLLQSKIAALVENNKERNNLKNALRKYVDDVYDSVEMAEQNIKNTIRFLSKENAELLKTMYKGVCIGESDDDEEIIACPAYDILTLVSIAQETRK